MIILYHCVSARSFRALLERDDNETVAVDLESCEVRFPDGSVHAFKLDEARRETLLQGLYPIAVAASREQDIAAFDARDRQARPWIWSGGNRRLDP